MVTYENEDGRKNERRHKNWKVEARRDRDRLRHLGREEEGVEKNERRGIRDYKRRGDDEGRSKNLGRLYYFRQDNQPQRGWIKGSQVKKKKKEKDKRVYFVSKGG